MKKFACLLVAIMMCLSAVAMAESVPSKSTSDMTQIESTTAVAVPEGVEAPAIAVLDAANEDAAAQEKVAVCEEVLADLAASVEAGAAPAAFFGEVKNAAGEAVVIADTAKVAEFMPLVVSNYDPSYESMTAKMTFATQYEENQKVTVLVGIVTVDAEGAKTIAWTAFEGVGTADGAVEVTFDAETLLAIQEGTALLAVISE